MSWVPTCFGSGEDGGRLGVSDVNIQIFGTKRCPDSRKTERFFKERGIRFQAIDLAQKGMSAGELRSVAARVGGAEQLIDRAGKRYLERGLKYAAPTGPRIEQMLVDDPPAVAHPGGPRRQPRHHRLLPRGLAVLAQRNPTRKRLVARNRCALLALPSQPESGGWHRPRRSRSGGPSSRCCAGPRRASRSSSLPAHGWTPRS